MPRSGKLRDRTRNYPPSGDMVIVLSIPSTSGARPATQDVDDIQTPGRLFALFVA